MASEHRAERQIMSHIDDMMTILMIALEAASTHVMIGLGVVNLVHVITKDSQRDAVFEWELK
jgi:hypothetical protein